MRARARPNLTNALLSERSHGEVSVLFAFMWMKSEISSRSAMTELRALGTWGGRGDLSERNSEEFSEAMEIFCTLLCLVVTQFYTAVKIQQSEHIRYVPFFVCKLYLPF